MDSLTAQQRSERMSRIRGKDTKPELLVRRHLHAKGFRFRLHRKELPGKPDLVLPKYQAVVLVQGCFWHGHECQKGRVPGTRSDFWRTKIEANRVRDAANKIALEARGWRVLEVWECDLYAREKRERTLGALVQALRRDK